MKEQVIGRQKIVFAFKSLKLKVDWKVGREYHKQEVQVKKLYIDI